MKILPAIIAAIAISATTPLAAHVSTDDGTAIRTSPEGTASAQKPTQLMLAGSRRNKCQERLGYGRTGSYGCG
jgi:hypothetical protein